ncbi:hypothetical protein ACFLXY_06450 [Chloroflexota bacterium]
MTRTKRKKSRLAKRSGDFGRRMVRCFTVLDSYRLREQYSRGWFFGTRELCILSGVPYRSLTRCLPEWVSKGYVEMRSATAPHVGDYEYRLCSPGKSWLYDARTALPKHNDFYKDLVSWVNCCLRNYDILLQAQFNTMVICINTMLKQVKTEHLDHVKLYYDTGGVLIIGNREDYQG